jgi:cysteine desulfurase
LYVRKKKPKVEIFPLQYGGGHERKMRSGTLNVPGIVGLGKAVEICQQEMSGESVRLAKFRDQLVGALTTSSAVLSNTAAAMLLPHVANLRFNFAGGDQLVRKLSKNLAVSAGSACSSVSVAPSHVLKAMSLSDDEALSSIRFSLGRFTTAEELEQSIQYVLEVCPGSQLIQ